MQYAHINSRGLEQIYAALDKHHKFGRAHLTPAILDDLIAEAEGNFLDGEGCRFEIPRHLSRSGLPIEVTISPDGYEIEVAEDPPPTGP